MMSNYEEEKNKGDVSRKGSYLAGETFCMLHIANQPPVEKPGIRS